jgi:hypothetical protein
MMGGGRVGGGERVEHVAIRLRAEERKPFGGKEERERERKRVAPGESAPCIEKWRWRMTRV